MDEKQKLLHIIDLLDKVDAAYYNETGLDNEYGELQVDWDKGYELCYKVLETIDMALDKGKNHD